MQESPVDVKTESKTVPLRQLRAYRAYNDVPLRFCPSCLVLVSPNCIVEMYDELH
jgi:hypothetical protein